MNPAEWPTSSEAHEQPGQPGVLQRRAALTDLLAAAAPLLMEGGVVERVRRGAPDLLDPLLMNAPLVYSEAGRALLHQIFFEYMAIGQAHDLPLLSLAPTWRANPDRLAASDYEGRDLNGDAVRFLQAIRAEFGAYGAKIYIGGLMGCRGDAYKPQEAMPRAAARAFHWSQAQALAAAGADYLLASTMPELQEALGMAEALAATGCPFLVSLIVRPSGCLLDGTPMDEVMVRLDTEVAPRPLGYLVNCIHSSALGAALDTPAGQRALATGRLLGLQANTSAKSPEELDGSDELDGESPALFAAGMCGLRTRFGLRVLGGCCGTDASHIEALAQGLSGA